MVKFLLLFIEILLIQKYNLLYINKFVKDNDWFNMLYFFNYYVIKKIKESE